LTLIVKQLRCLLRSDESDGRKNTIDRCDTSATKWRYRERAYLSTLRTTSPTSTFLRIHRHLDEQLTVTSSRQCHIIKHKYRYGSHTCRVPFHQTKPENVSSCRKPTPSESNAHHAKEKPNSLPCRQLGDCGLERNRLYMLQVTANVFGSRTSSSAIPTVETNYRAQFVDMASRPRRRDGISDSTETQANSIDR
jgi:hypothetical protein